MLLLQLVASVQGYSGRPSRRRDIKQMMYDTALLLWLRLNRRITYKESCLYIMF